MPGLNTTRRQRAYRRAQMALVDYAAGDLRNAAFMLRCAIAWKARSMPQWQSAERAEFVDRFLWNQ